MNQNVLARAKELLLDSKLNQFKEIIGENPGLLSAQFEDTQYTLLHFAAKEKQPQIAKFLLDSGAPLDVYPQNSYFPKDKGAGNGSWTPLVQALNAQSFEIAEMIAEKEICPNNLWVAVGLRRKGLVDSFFDQSGTLKDNAGDPGKLQTQQEILDDALSMASHVGSRELIEFLLDKGADINGRDHWGMTALHWAIDCHPDNAQYLIEKGANVLTRDAQHVATAFMWAKFFENEKLADYILENCTLHICDAVAIERIDLVKNIIEENPELIHGPLGLEEPLRVAANKGNQKILEYLLEKGARPTSYEVRPGMFDPPELKFTALGWAREKGHQKVSEILSQAGAVK